MVVAAEHEVRSSAVLSETQTSLHSEAKESSQRMWHSVQAVNCEHPSKHACTDLEYTPLACTLLHGV